MRVRAVKAGYDGTRLRREDAVFDWPEGVKLGSWVEAVDALPKDQAVELSRAKERAEHARILRQSAGPVSEADSPGSRK